ncbi:hypothetical protein CEP51_001718 [Fusarium floridanum]|uniref:Uncharacterized protein n=1 Tax=Fusarium floridanum TaxID=1325733 RepID=A0A428SF24_9HYPO|nr:hypothetical protein CEP51_001718 [Fusarium floridanum]
MPTLTADRPELQILWAIDQFIVPLVKNRVAEDSQHVKFLAAYNLLYLMRVELSLLRFWISRACGLEEEADYDFFEDLQPLLQLLEDFINFKSLGWRGLDTPSYEKARRYPKLRIVIQEVSDNDTVFDLTKVICLPGSKAPARAAYETVAKFNANNQRRIEGNNLESPSDQANFDVDHPCLRRSELCKSMFKAWAHHFSTSSCHSHHVGKLQACPLELDGSGLEDLVQHKMFISPCDPENRWQEATCTVSCNLDELSPSLCEVDDICQTIGDSLSNEEIMSLWMRSERILHDPEADQGFVDNIHISPTLSLEQILQQPTSKFGPNARVTLAYNLACTLLQTYNSEMKQREWGPGDIYFLYNPEDGTIHEPDHPYVAATFFSDRQPVEIKDKFPVLVHFAKLLLEIGLGQLFVPKRVRLDVELIQWAQSDEAKESLTQGYLEAVQECLRATKSKSRDDPTDEETQCRKIIFSLVSHLDKARHNYRSLDPKRTQQVSMPDSKLTELPVGTEIPQQHPLSREDISELLPRNRMFDEKRLRSCDDDQSNINSARAFLDMAERFYTSSMRGFTSSPDIRIAILDTGIHTGNSFIKGAKYSRRSQDSPIKELKSFVSKHFNDECGHGTNVASLILRIFPEANLYIAKISSGVEQDGVNQIVEAIEWARSYNVHIINMSFSIPKTSEVKKIIKEAENTGVIFFVAASNNGVHAGRSFPATLDTVLCIHATDGKGNKGSMNPDPESHRDNFSTLGVAIPSVWENGVYLSGTSYATPVAAGMAGVILSFIKAAVAAGKMPKESIEEAFDRQGMKNILLAMTMLRDGYHCIVPWREFWPLGSGQDTLIASIEKALK